jgi:anti-sigma regulatory factor (Ser/Thr protein kinase)
VRDETTQAVGGSPALRAELTATPEAIGELRGRARDFAARAGAEDAVVGDIALAISEAATNAVLHAYRDIVAGPVRLTGRVEGEWLQFEVSDHGRGFHASPSGGLGFGMKVMAEVSDSMTVRQGDEGTTVTLRFSRSR